ncbi:methyltransferase domain-containing protein [Candidatus Pacearchaeota archaeon]|nr:methyltransferase domain-containing protein [Candidatus Pacearchaeota archaeon]
MSVFDKYASFYDKLYEDKEYVAECDFIESILEKFSDRPVRKILDLGCGTGGHSIPLSKRGYILTGVDLSREMLEGAKQKSDLAGVDIDFRIGDIRYLSLQESFDTALAMFAVISYQTTNDDLIAAFKTARRHLEPNGLFIFDTWFGPSVMTIQPSVREKTIRHENKRIVRIARPSLDINKHLVDVDYTVKSFEGDKLKEEVHESHQMRFLFVPEVQLLCKITDFELIHYCPFMDLEKQPTEDDWNVTWITRVV